MLILFCLNHQSQVSSVSTLNWFGMSMCLSWVPGSDQSIKEPVDMWRPQVEHRLRRYRQNCRKVVV